MPSHQTRRKSSLADDAAHLANLGHQQELKRHHSTLSMLGLAFAILNSWTALAASLNLALPSGGTTAVLWGLITAGLCNLCLAASLAEFLSAYPTAAGQYHWAAIVSTKKWAPIASWVTGWVNTFGWIALTATAGLLGSQLIVGIISFMSESYEPKSWHQFLIYIGYTLLEFTVNAFLNRILPAITQTAFIWSITGFVVISITVLACASPDYQSAKYVYGNFTNTTGWPDGFSWMLGLLQGAFALTGFDATAHCIEEMPNPTVEGPKLMLYCILIGMFTGWVFLSCLLFVVTDPDQAITSSAGPLLQIFYDATKNKAGAICLMMFPLICLVFAGIGIMTTSSRMSYAFARDRGLPFSKHFAKIQPGLDVPLNALFLTTFWVVVFGCIFLGSSSAFNAITSAAVIALGISYAIPTSINMFRGRKMLPPNRPFVLPGALGWICNIVGVLWTLLTTVLFMFPPDLPVTGNNMNYAIAAFAVVVIISTATWIFDGRKNFHGPRVEEAMVKDEVMGLQVETNQSQAQQEYRDEKKVDPGSEANGAN